MAASWHKKRAPFCIYGEEVAPGESRTIELPIAELYTHTTLTMPLRVLHGRKDGPVMFVNAAIHGDEINGVEIVRRLVKSRALKNLRGTLLIIPVVNVFGFIDHSRYLPDRRDLNRCFPGSEKGSMAARLAWMFMQEVVQRSDYGIDLHTGSNFRRNLPQMRVCLDQDGVEELAQAFGAPVILDAPLRDGSLRAAAAEMGTPVLVFETGEPMQFSELGIRSGVKGIIAVMRALGMLPPSKARRKREAHVARSSSWTRAPQSGILSSKFRLGDVVRKGQKIGEVSDTFADHPMDVQANVSGMIIGMVSLYLVNEGSALFHIAEFPDARDARATAEAFRAETVQPIETQPGT